MVSDLSLVSRICADLRSQLPGTKVFPVFNRVCGDGPSIEVSRIGIADTQTKSDPARSAAIEVRVYHADYDSGCELAISVVTTIATLPTREARIRRACLTDVSDAFEGDKFVQILTFSVGHNYII